MASQFDAIQNRLVDLGKAQTRYQVANRALDSAMEQARAASVEYSKAQIAFDEAVCQAREVFAEGRTEWGVRKLTPQGLK